VAAARAILARMTERTTNFAAAIYGSILVAALVSTLDAEHATAGAMSVAVLSTMVVFWIAHVWADAVAERVTDPTPLSVARVRRIARVQWPMVQTAIGPLVALALASAGAWSLHVGVDVALAVSVAQLAAWGIVIGLRTASSWPAALLSGLVDGLLGVAIVALKTLVH
jgi:hypothetical protein